MHTIKIVNRSHQFVSYRDGVKFGDPESDLWSAVASYGKHFDKRWLLCYDDIELYLLDHQSDGIIEIDEEELDKILHRHCQALGPVQDALYNTPWTPVR